MEKYKKLLQNKGETLAYLHKMFFKSHDMSQIIQFLLLLVPIILSIISLSNNGIKILDILAVVFTVLALGYYQFYGKNQELFMERGEKYLVLYKKAESYYKKGDFDNIKIRLEDLDSEINSMSSYKKPCYHLLAKTLVDRIMEKETKYANEKKVWRK